MLKHKPINLKPHFASIVISKIVTKDFSPVGAKNRLARLNFDAIFEFLGQFKGTNGRQKTYEIFHGYRNFYSGFMCQTTVIFGITKDGSLY